jgi:subtilisin-like proprotein convertase family protein
VIGLGLLAWVAPASADTNTASIAVPILGTQGPGAPYPSTITVTARGGPAHTSAVDLVLRGVTHPCPEELAVLLVHGSQKYLVMSNAGGCRALQGTDIQFKGWVNSVIPDSQPATPAYTDWFDTLPSNYGAVPVFPAPAPTGPYTLGLPPAGTNVNGTWELYVMDTKALNRGVIAGGWSLHYDTTVQVTASQALVQIPTMGPAQSYPITFNLTSVPTGVPVRGVVAEISLQHTFPDHVRMVLQSPAGTSVVLMANAGGDTNINAKLTFLDNASVSLPDSTTIFAGFYKPTAFGATTIPAPGPTSGYATTLAAFDGEPVRGTWKLWVYDDTAFDSGTLTTARLSIVTEASPTTTLTPSPPATANQPFVRITGQEGPGNTLISPHGVGWRVTNGGVFYDAGPFTFTPGTNSFSADVPLRQGTNVVSFRSLNTGGYQGGGNANIVVNEFTYSFAEGATGSFFDLDLTLANPQSTDAPVTIDFLPEGGTPIPFAGSIAANSLFPLAVDSIVPAASVSAVVHSTQGIPLAAERTMIWDTSGYGGHGGTAVAPSTRWLFAEGAQGFFNTFVLMANDNASPVDVTVKFLIEGGGVMSVPITIPAKTRHTLFAGDVQAIVNTSFGIDITASAPIIAERAMYLPGARLFEGGHESAGVNETSKQWFLAEGATGSFFDCFVLISNPNGGPAQVTLSYLLPSGTTITKNIVVPANSRFTINVETEDPQLVNADVSTTVTSDIGIVVERAMYWPNIAQGWREAHNSFGVTSSSLRWGVADGRIGGPRAFQTFLLLANPNPFPAEVLVRFLKAGFTVTRTYTLNPSSRQSIYANADVPELGEGTFSADVQVLNYQPIAVEKALYWNAGTEVFAGGTNVAATRLPPP